MKPIFLIAACAAALGLLSQQRALAQDFPTRPIKVIVPFGAGSATDAVARIVGEKVSADLKQPVIVENMAGASGVLAAQAVARAAPDGTTLLVTTNTTHGANQSLLARVPYDAVSDFEPVTKLGTTSLILVTNPSMRVTSVRELIGEAKANPGKLTFGSGSSSSRVAGEMLKVRAGIDLAHVPYRSIPPAVTDVLGGQIAMVFADIQSSIPHIRAGTLKALAVSGPARIAVAPELPTMVEAGVPDYDITAWYAVFAPAKTPRSVVDRLHKAYTDAVRDPAVAARLLAAGVETAPSSSEELKGFVVAEIKKWADIVKAAGIQPE